MWALTSATTPNVVCICFKDNQSLLTKQRKIKLDDRFLFVECYARYLKTLFTATLRLSF